MKIFFIPVLLVLIAVSCTSSDPEQESQESLENIIFLIGDGMGLSAVTTTFYFGDESSEFKRFHHIGLVNTSSAVHKVGESASTGTAMSTGTKTYRHALGLGVDRDTLKNIIEFVSEMGWSTGLIATSSVTHATPASFYAHVGNRYDDEEEVAVQLLHSEVDFFAGGGIQFFNKREDHANLFKTAEQNGFTLDTIALINPSALSADQKYGYLLAEEGMPSIPGGRGDFLPEATSLALDYLSLDEAGFFLMVEGSYIDKAGHDNDGDRLLAEVDDFEKAISVAMDFAEQHGNTLVVVTADHETGGLALAPEYDEATGKHNYENIELAFATGKHSATLCPVFAFGPGAEKFMGIYDNNQLFHKMLELVRSGE